jgi:hypothetical protein
MTTLTNSQIMRRKLGFVLPELVSSGEAVLRHPHFAEIYPEYLFTMHCMIRASVPLMERALEQAHALAVMDPAAAGVAAYLSQHVREELHHDDWLLDDLAVLGVDRAATLRRPPPASVAAMVGSQYYYIFHYHPIAILGYIGVMEGYPPTEEQCNELQQRSGLPRNAFRTIRKHAILDPGHRDDLDRALDGLVLSPEQTAIIGISAMESVRLASSAFREIVQRAPLAQAS